MGFGKIDDEFGAISAKSPHGGFFKVFEVCT
jgi:hypothetical protein